MSEQQHANTVHWDSSLMAINPARIERREGTITKTVYREDKVWPILAITVRDYTKNLEKTLILTHTISEDDTPDEKLPKIPTTVQAIYDDFGVTTAEGLIRRQVIGLYFGAGLVGIVKK